MKTLIATLVTLASLNASADGFSCLTAAEDLKITVYNMVDPNMGTRSVATMVVSDPIVAYGRKTIAKFSASQGTLATSHNYSSGLLFKGEVDLRFTELSRGGEYILGTRLENVDTLSLYVDFTYGDNLADGDETAGYVTVLKRNGEVVRSRAVCTRYIKN